MKDFFGYGRSRSSTDSNVLTRHFNEYVNCLHTQVDTARENMEVLVAEFDMDEIKYVEQMQQSQNSRVIEPIACAMRGRNPDNPSERSRSNGKYKQRLEMGNNISNTITSVQKDALVAEPTSPSCIQVGNIYPDSENMANRSGGRVYSKEGCSPTILSRDFKTPKLIADTKPDECRLVGGSWDGWQDDRVFDIEGSSPTLDTNSEKRPRIQGEATSYRIRKLTPRECFRLMGVSETDIDKIQQSGVSQSQQYKMAGNSIVVDVLEHIFRKMFIDTGQESQQLSLF